MPALLDRIKETTTSVGTGDVSLAGAVAGYRSFSLFGDGAQCYYTRLNRSNNEWEVGIGTVQVGSPNMLSRDTILENSDGTYTALNFSAGTQEIFCDIPASQLGLGRYGGYSTDYLFDTTTTGSGIAATKLRLNNASFASVTHVFLHKSQRYNVSVAAFLASFTNSGTYGYLKIYKESTLDDNWIFLRITALTDQVTYVDLTVTYADSHGSFSADDVLVVTFSPCGPQGVAGAQGPVGVGTPGPAGVAAVNLLDNPCFMWDQLNPAGAGASVVITDDTYFCDRWYALKNGTGTITTSQNTPVPGLYAGMGFVWPSATGLGFGIAQIVSARRFTVPPDMYTGPVSLSFVSAIGSGSMTWRYALLSPSSGSFDAVTSDVVSNWASTSYTSGGFFIGGLTVVATGSFTNTTAPTTFEFENLTIPSGVGNLIVFVWQEATSVGGSVYLSNFTLTKTTEAVAFDYADPWADLTECKRYYQKSTRHEVHPAQAAPGTYVQFRFNGPAVTNPVITQTANFEVEMRDVPAVTLYNAAGSSGQVDYCGGAATSTTVTSTGKSAIVQASGTYSGSDSRLNFNWVADAQL